MAETLVAVAVGIVSAVLAWAVARWCGPAGTTRTASSSSRRCLSLFTLGSAALMPHARAWKQEREVEALLRDAPLFAAALEEEPSLRGPLREALLGAVRGGGRARRWRRDSGC